MIANLHYFPDSIREYFGERHLLPLRGGAARHRRRRARVRGVLRRRAVPGDLRRRADRHRPDGARRAPPRGGRDRDAGGQAGRRHARVRRRAARPRRAHHGLSGEARARRRRCRTSATAGSTCSRRRSSTTSPTARSSTGRNDVFPALLENDVPFHIHEIARVLERRRLARRAAPGHLRRAARARCTWRSHGEEVAPGVTVAGGVPAARPTPRSTGRCGSARTCSSARRAPDGAGRARRRRERRRRRAAAREHRLPGHRGRGRSRS